MSLNAAQADADLLLLLDVGGHAVKAQVRERGGALRAAERTLLSDGERRGEDVLEAVETAIAKVAGELGRDLQNLGAAGLAVARADTLCWSRMTGQTFSPILGWQDRRGAGLIESLALDPRRVRRLTGLPLSPHYGASKMHWCLAELPAVGEALLEGNLAWGPLGSYLINRLTEERRYAVDPTLAQRTQLWDRDSGDWSAELAAAFDIPEFTLPRVIPSLSEFGHLRVLGRRVPLLACAGDQNTVPFAAGQPDPHCLYLNLGSGAFLLAPRPPADCAGGWLDTRLPRDEPAAFACEATVNGAANALEWWAAKCGITFTAQSLAQWLAADPGDCVFLNGINGLGSPWWRSEFASRYVGGGDAAARGRAVAESIAFLVNANLQSLPENAIGRCWVSGGLAASEGFVQLLADATGLPMDCAASPEATLDGLFALLGGSVESAPARRISPVGNPGLHARQRRWQDRMPAVPGSNK